MRIVEAKQETFFPTEINTSLESVAAPLGTPNFSKFLRDSKNPTSLSSNSR